MGPCPVSKLDTKSSQSPIPSVGKKPFMIINTFLDLNGQSVKMDDAHKAKDTIIPYKQLVK